MDIFKCLVIVRLYLNISLNSYFKQTTMSWLCSNVSTSNLLLTTQTISYHYRTHDTKTHQIYNETIPIHQQGHSAFRDWRRTRIESLDVNSIRKSLKQNKQHFIDPLFPHHNSMLSRDHFQQKIEWVRIRDCVENAVYSKQQTISALQKIKLNRVEFQKALILIARGSPTLYKEILTKTLNPQGVYEFKIFRNGLIKNIVIDDYIPVHKGQPIFVGPVRQNEVYPILLEKALAKACGGYENIPQDCEQIMEMIFCGPVKKYQVQKLKENNSINETVGNSLKRRYLSVLISKKDSRLKNYGLNQNQIYNLINVFKIKTEKGSQQNVYELMSQSKISAWNGKYSLNHEIWSQMDLNSKMKYYNTIKNNKSFLINQTDISRHFQELLIFQALDTKNKDWIQNFSENQVPSFTAFQLEKDDNIFLRVTTPSKIRHCLILVKETSHRNYDIISTSFNQNTYKTEVSMDLTKGKYILAVYHQWYLQTSNNYYIFLSSLEHVELRKGGVKDTEFLSKVLIKYEEQLAKNDKNVPKMYAMRVKVQEMGLAWLYLKPEDTKSKSLTINIDHQKLKNENWEVLQPYKDTKVVNITSEKIKEDRLIILKKSEVEADKKQYFPVGAFVLKE